MTIWTPKEDIIKDKDVVLAVEQLKAININLKVEVHDWSTYLQEVKMAPEETKCSMYIFGWGMLHKKLAIQLILYSQRNSGHRLDGM